MRALLSTIGSRGDVEPLIALALQLKALGHEVRLCVPPDFLERGEGMGMRVTPIGPELRAYGKAKASAGPPTPEQRQQLVEATVAAQFAAIAEAAQGCDVIVGATALQIAARSVADKLGIRYVFAAYCPAVLPSPRHAPPVLGLLGDMPTPAARDYADLWERDRERFNSMFGAALNAHRASLGLSAIDDVRSYVFGERPWLAAEPTLAPWPEPGDASVLQTGAWIVPDQRPLSAEVEAFLDGGDPPIYFGFGSIRVANDTKTMVEAARALGRRAIIARGWADLSLADQEPDCLVIDEVNQQALFKRVAVTVHHGGAGTTTVAALSAAPQVIVPQMYDQHYWGQRVEQLGIGSAHAAGALKLDSLTGALRDALQSDVRAQAKVVASAMQGDGARVAALHLLEAGR
jgi:vancomycin aglycone glucosyltransferase